jgi:hypothetical protein
MTPFEMGRVSAFLLKHRKIEDRTDKRGLRKDERDLAELLRHAPLDALTDLGELLNGYGFELFTLTSTDILGIGAGERVHILARKPNIECPLLDLGRAVERMQPASGKVTSGKIWLTQFWLLHLDLIYYQKDRSPEERNKWMDATFTLDQLIQLMRDHINGSVRRLNPEQVQGNEVYEALTSEKGTDIPKYARRFLDLMCDCGLLDHKGNDVYRQTLLSAVEMKENYGRVLAPLVLQSNQELGNVELAGFAGPLLIDTSKSEGDGQ